MLVLNERIRSERTGRGEEGNPLTRIGRIFTDVLFESIL